METNQLEGVMMKKNKLNKEDQEFKRNLIKLKKISERNLKEIIKNYGKKLYDKKYNA